MGIEAWPYAVGRGLNTGYQAFVVPDFLAADNNAYLLEYASGGEVTAPGCVTARDVSGTSFGPLTLVYRVIEPSGDRYGLGDGRPLRDGAGRPVRVYEGFAVRLDARHTASLGLTEEDFDTVRRTAEPTYRSLWTAPRSVNAAQSSAIQVGDRAGGAAAVAVTVIDPYVVPRGTVKQRRSPDASRRPEPEWHASPRPALADTATQRPRPRVSGRLLGALAATATLAAVVGHVTAASNSAAQSQQADVTQVYAFCASLHNGDAANAFGLFSADYQESTRIKEFTSALLDSNSSGTCQQISVTVNGSSAVAELSLMTAREKRPRTVELSLTQINASWQLTSMTVGGTG